MPKTVLVIKVKCVRHTPISVALPNHGPLTIHCRRASKRAGELGRLIIADVISPCSRMDAYESFDSSIGMEYSKSPFAIDTKLFELKGIITENEARSETHLN
jgi:hypothetical protein